MGSRLLHLGRHALPAVISVALLAWLTGRTPPREIAASLAGVNWPLLLVISVLQLVGLFLWDAVSLWWLFSQPNRRLPFRTVLRARVDASLWTAVNLEIGQGVFALELARATGGSVAAALGRCVVIGLFDFGSLMSLGLFAWALRPDDRLRHLLWVCAVGFCGLLLLAAALRLLPGRWRRWLEAQTWGNWLAWWTWQHTACLFAQRLVLLLGIVLYAGAGLAICRIPISALEVLGVVPFVLLAEAIPSTGGLGTREAALIYLLGVRGEQQAVVLAFSLTWSLVLMAGRIGIGLIGWLWPRHSESDAGPERHDPATRPRRDAAAVVTSEL